MPPRKCLKIRPSKGESESIFSSLSVENNGISVYYISFKFYFSIKSCLIATCIEYSYHACMIIFSFVATKHLDIASYMPYCLLAML